MNKVLKFQKLNREDKYLLIKTYLMLWIVRLMLWVFKVQTILSFSEKYISPNKNHISIQKIVWAINSTSPYVPRASCLTRSIVSKDLFKQYGYESEIKIGVAKDEKGHLNAHAWVEIRSETVIGHSEVDYTPILKDLNEYSNLKKQD